MKSIIENIRIVMVGTTHPGNIGAAARAMKTMSHRHLYLVKPKIFPSAEASARAAGADDILANVTVCETLGDAIRDCKLVIATSARHRSIPWPVFGPRECATRIINVAKSDKVALVFGPESSGLSNEDLEDCNAMVQIPGNPDFKSLNIASAIQILCYENLQAAENINNEKNSLDGEYSLVTSDQMKLFYEHLEQCMIDVDFYDPEKPRRLMRRLKRLFNRSQLDDNELNILRGFLAAVQESLRRK